MLTLEEVLGLQKAEHIVRHAGSEDLARIIANVRGGNARLTTGYGYDPKMIGRVGARAGMDASFTSIAMVEERLGTDTFLRFNGLLAGDQSGWFSIRDPQFAEDGIIRIVARDVGTAPATSASRGVGILNRMKCSDDLTRYRAWSVGPCALSGSAARRLRVVDSAATLGQTISNVVVSSTPSGVTFGNWYTIEMATKGHKFGGRIMWLAAVNDPPVFGSSARFMLQYDATALGWTDGQAGFDIRLNANTMSVDIASISWSPLPPDMPEFS